jgi:hypothetical protein
MPWAIRCVDSQRQEPTGVDMDHEDSGKQPYERPSLTIYGDLRELTAGASGLERDGGVGSTKSKLSGGA